MRLVVPSEPEILSNGYLELPARLFFRQCNIDVSLYLFLKVALSRIKRNCQNPEKVTATKL